MPRRFTPGPRIRRVVHRRLHQVGPEPADQTLARAPRSTNYELDADVGVYANFGLVAQLRTESPLMDVGGMEFQPLSTDPRAIKYERVSTAWNALNFWRSLPSFGIRWRWGQGQQINILATEDFGTGNRDELGTAFYSNNAPDFGFVTQFT